jgi:phytoene dehydrogenase-like protein
VTYDSDAIVIGAGLAGLTCARELVRAGFAVSVVEASDAIGGRVRTDEVDGLLLDWGFQLINPAYPEVQRALDVEALALRSFTPGAQVLTDSGSFVIADPRRGGSLFGALRADVGSKFAKSRFAAYALGCAVASPKGLAQRPDVSAFDALRSAGVSNELIDKFIRPFLAGVFLENSLATSRRFMDLVLRSFVRGTPAVPARGMQAIPLQIAEGIPRESIALGVRALSIDRQTVHLTSGSHRARAIVVATDAPGVSMLLPDLPVPQARAVTTWYHLAHVPPQSLTRGKPILVLDGRTARGPLTNTVVLSHAAPSYASHGRVLVSSSAVGLHGAMRHGEILGHLSELYSTNAAGWELVNTYEIPYALPAQDPPFARRLPVDLGGGIFVAGDHRDTASIQGALVSGRRAAESVKRHLGGLS